MKRVGIEDVARAAKVSIATVSRVINNAEVVSQDTRRRVEEVIHALSYRPHPMARRLAGGKTNIFILALPYFEGLFNSFFAAELLRGVGEGVAAKGCDLLVHITKDQRPLNLALCDGVILAGLDQHPALLRQSLEAGVLCVVVNHLADDPRAVSIGIDNQLGASLCVDHLISLGHCRIGTITGSLKTQAGKDRLAGFQAALKRRHLPLREEWVLVGDFSPLSACTAVESFLMLKERPTALVVASDEMAMAAIEALQEHRLQVPGDCSIVGFDDSPAADLFHVPLTTVAQPLRQLGCEAVETLYHWVREGIEPGHRRLLPVKLVVRQSTAPPKQGSQL